MQPVEIENTTGDVREILDAVVARFGVLPNYYATAASSPPYLRAQAALVGALGRGGLRPGLREQIAIAVAQYNECGYCLPAHVMVGTAFAGLSAEQAEQARRFTAPDPKEAAALAFSHAVLQTRGDVGDADLAAARAAGLDDADLGGIVAEISLNVLRNYFNRLARTQPDAFFPEVDPLPAVAGGCC